MDYFIASFLILAIVIVIMAVGVIFSNIRIKGSCGGLNQLDPEDTPNCGCADPCILRKRAMEKKALREVKQA